MLLPLVSPRVRGRFDFGRSETIAKYLDLDHRSIQKHLWITYRDQASFELEVVCQQPILNHDEDKYVLGDVTGRFDGPAGGVLGRSPVIKFSLPRDA